MPRLDVYAMPAKGGPGYVIDVQADLLSSLATRTVAPLLPVSSAPKPINELNPVFEIQGEQHVLIPQAIASIPCRELKQLITSLAAFHDIITRALDILLTGY
jgi:toxin CcdB